MNKMSHQDRNAMIALLERGFGQREVARLLGISKDTVGSFCRRVVQKTNRSSGRPPLGEKGKIHTVLIRVTEADDTAFRAAAERRGCKSLSAWIRMVLNERVRNTSN